MSKQTISWTNASQFLCSQCREIVIPAWLISPIFDFYCRSCALVSVYCINKTALQWEDLLLFVPLVWFFFSLCNHYFSECLSNPLHSLSQKFSTISVLYLKHGIRLVVHVVYVSSVQQEMFFRILVKPCPYSTMSCQQDLMISELKTSSLF